MTGLRPLRPPQIELLGNIRSALAAGYPSVMAQLPTGGGKTEIAAHIVDGLLRRDRRICFSVPTIDLVDQTIDRFAANGIDRLDMGAMQGNHPWSRPGAPIQIATGQTLALRALPDVDAVIIDEAHRRFRVYDRWIASTLGRQISSLARETEAAATHLAQPWSPASGKLPRPFFIGLSATPWAKGLGQLFDVMVKGPRTQDLIDEGYLSPFVVYAPSHPDLTGVRTTAGDYNEGDLAERMNKDALVADIVSTWLRLGDNRPTLCFCTGRDHARAVHDRFTAAGVSAAYVDANTPRDERAEIGRELAAGTIKVVCNIGCLCLDEETEILTSDGFVGIDDMTYDHLIAAWHPDGIEFTKPKFIVRREREANEKMVSVEGRVHNIRVTGNHRMLWSSTPWAFSVKSAEEIAGKRGYVPVSGHAHPATFDMLCEHPEHTTKRINALAYSYRKMGYEKGHARRLAVEHVDYKSKNCVLKNPSDLTEDECHFIGFWLGDGTRSGGRFSVAQSVVNGGIVEWFDGVVSRLRLHHTRSSYDAQSCKSTRWNFSSGRGGLGQRVDGGLAHLDDYLDKDGSELYWGLDRKQFGALLHGLWMADGNHGPDGNGSGYGRSIVGANKKLFELLQAIGACRGMRIGFKVRARRDDGSPALYSISILDQEAAMLHRERLAIEEGWKQERVWCVTSTTSYLITRRKGKVTVVGNTTGIDWDVRCLILARPTKSEMLFVQIIGRALRTAPGKDRAIILDHSDTHLRLGMVTDIDHDELDDGRTDPAAKRKAAEERGLPLPKECLECAGLIPASSTNCPCCGAAVPRKAFVEVEGELAEFQSGGRRPSNGKGPKVSDVVAAMGKESVYRQLRYHAHERGRSDGWVAHTYREVFGVWPRGMPADEYEQPLPVMRSWLRSRDIAYAKSAKARQSVKVSHV